MPNEPIAQIRTLPGAQTTRAGHPTGIDVADTPPSSLFIYGTLMPGERRWPLLAPFVVGRPQRAAAVGALYDSGLGYPVLSLEGHELIAGLLVELDTDRLDEALSFLDSIEGLSSGLFTRVTLRVRAEGASSASAAQSYVGSRGLLSRVSGAPELPSGAQSAGRVAEGQAAELAVVEAREGLLQLRSCVENGLWNRSGLWGGARVVIADAPEASPAEDHFYPEPTYVVTPHAAELSWLFKRLWEIMRPALWTHKHDFFAELAGAALQEGTEQPEAGVRRLLRATIDSALSYLDRGACGAARTGDVCDMERLPASNRVGLER